MAETWGKGTNTVHYICSTYPSTFNEEFIIDLDTNKPINNRYNHRLEGMMPSYSNEYFIFDDDSGIRFEIDAISGKFTEDISSHWGSSEGKESFSSGTCKKSSSLSLEHPSSAF